MLASFVILYNRFYGNFLNCSTDNNTEPTVEELAQLEEAGWRPGDDMNSWEHFV